MAEARDQGDHAAVDLVVRVEALLLLEDPVGINVGGNADEYRPEARAIVLRLPEANSERDVAVIIHEEFVRWFDAPTAGSIGRYRFLASAVWRLWFARQGKAGG